MPPKTPPSSEATFDAELDRADFDAALAGIGIELSRLGSDRVYDRVQRVASRSGGLSITQVRSIVDEVVSGTEILQGVAESFR